MCQNQIICCSLKCIEDYSGSSFMYVIMFAYDCTRTYSFTGPNFTLDYDEIIIKSCIVNDNNGTPDALLLLRCHLRNNYYLLFFLLFTYHTYTCSGFGSRLCCTFNFELGKVLLPTLESPARAYYLCSINSFFLPLAGSIHLELE